MDPLGFVAYSAVTGNWTSHERNTLQIPLDDVYLINRLLWVALGLILLVLAFARFRFTEGSARQRSDSAIGQESHWKMQSTPEIDGKSQPKARRDFSTKAAVMLFLKAAVFDFWSILRGIYFHLILAGIGLSLIALTIVQTVRWGTGSYPVTYTVLELLDNGFPLFILMIVTIYAGELVWRERENRSHEVYDALPVPDWVPLLSKIAALMGIQVVVAGCMMICGMVTQAVQGYYRFEIGLYAKELFVIKVSDYWLYCLLAVFVHVVINHKYLAHFALALFYVVQSNLASLGIHHNLLRFASDPGYVYSDMNGYGHFIAGLLWFRLYWGAFVALLGVVACLFWVRGCDTSLRARAKLATDRLTPGVLRLGLGIMVVFLCLGGWIYYNTNVLNRYEASWDQADRAAGYEKSYGSLRTQPQPKVTGLRLQLDLYPSTRGLHAVGEMVLRNKTSLPIRTFHVTLANPRMEILRLAPLSDHFLQRTDREQGVYEFRLQQPLEPGRDSPVGVRARVASARLPK